LEKFEATDDEVDEVDDAEGEILQIYPEIENGSQQSLTGVKLQLRTLADPLSN
jgi:hypothetical protein